MLKSLYGLNQASKQWNIKLIDALLDADFKQSSHDYFLFTLIKGQDMKIILVYMDYFLIKGSSTELINEAK